MTDGDDPDSGDERAAEDDDSTLAWETLGAQTVYACEGFDVVNEDVRFPNDVVAAYDWVAEDPTNEPDYEELLSAVESV